MQMVSDMLDPAPTGLKDANDALEELRQLIASPEGAREDGRLPTERELSRRLGIGRHALRRALDVLETEGLIWRRQGAGTFIGSRRASAADGLSALSRTTYEEVMEARLRLEPQLAQLAALRADGDDIARMAVLNHHCANAADAEGCELWDGAFHRQIAVAARNGMLLSLFDLLNRVRQDKTWQRTRDMAREGGGGNDRVARHHARIIAAIEARDPARAGEAMRDHLLDIQVRLLRRLTGYEAPDPGHSTLRHSPPEGT